MMSMFGDIIKRDFLFDNVNIGDITMKLKDIYLDDNMIIKNY